jgi:hypothetical protein
MKKILSAILVATMFIACLALGTNAFEVNNSIEDPDCGTIEANTVTSFDNETGVLTLTQTIVYTITADQDKECISTSIDIPFDTDLFTWKAGYGTITLNGTKIDDITSDTSDDNVVYSPRNNIFAYIEVCPAVVAGDVIVVVATAELAVTENVTEEMDVDFECYWVSMFDIGSEIIEYEDVHTVTIAPAAPAAPEYTKPATPGAQIKAACEACGTEAGVRFLMTINKAAADFEKVTAYGVVIETADGEYKYTADANTKKEVTDTEIKYAVVVTGAPAGTEFTATAFFMYGDTEVAGDSGAIKA